MGFGQEVRVEYASTIAAYFIQLVISRRYIHSDGGTVDDFLRAIWFKVADFDDHEAAREAAIEFAQKHNYTVTNPDETGHHA